MIDTRKVTDQGAEIIGTQTKLKEEIQIERNPVDITFKNVNYSVKTKEGTRKILQNMSGVCKSGTVTAILGPSGGGKTSLLNVLSGKIHNSSKVKLECDIRANGKSFDPEDFTKFSGYVMQNDILMEVLTVKECLQFSADLKLEGTQEYKTKKAQQMISLLKLEKCQNTFIGGHFLKGISGGERKRVNIGQELITDPSVIFLDEPTSGLDSFTAYIVVHILRNYAKLNHKTVIMSIHSPNGDIWNLFDNVMLLLQGNIIFQGPREDSVPYFKSIGLSCPMHQCAPDFFLSHMTPNNDNEKQFPMLISSYIEKQEPKVLAEFDTIQKAGVKYSEVQTSFLYQIKTVAGRNFKQIKRNPLFLRSRLVQTIFMALFMGIVYLDLPTLHFDSPVNYVSNRKGVLFSSLMGNFMQSMMGVVINFPQEKPVFLREEHSKYYSTASYLIGKLCLEWIVILIFPVIHSCIIYFMVGFNQNSAEQFFVYILITILMSFVGSALGLVSGSIVNSVRTASAIQPLFMLPFVLFSGFFKNRRDFAAWIGWIEFISPFKYGLEAIVTNEFVGLDSPIDVIKQNDYTIGKWYCILILLGFFLVFQTISGFVLYMKRGTLQ